MLSDGYKETEIGVIPEDWEVVKLGSLGTTYAGLSGKTKEDFGYGSPFITYMNVFSNNSIDANVVEYVNINSNEKQNKVKNGDIFFTVSSETKDEVGMTSVLLEEFENDTYINSFCFGFRLHNNEKLLPRFSKYLLREHNTRKRITFYGAGTTRINISKVKLMDLLLQIPPLKEQEKIADILSTADEKIDAIASQIQKAETLKKGLLQKLLSEGIGHSEFKDSELGKIPESWKIVELGNVAKLNKQKYTPIQSESINYIGLEHIVQEQGVINGIGNSNDRLSQKNCFNKGEILFGKLRPYLRKFYLAEIDGVCSTEILVIKAKDNILNSILFQIIKTEAFIEHSVSKVFGTKMPRTSWAILQEFRLALPPIEEQKQIADILSTADEKLEVLRAKKEKYETLKKGLLQKLLSGEVRV